MEKVFVKTVRNAVSFAVVLASAFVCACSTPVFVDSRDNPNATYNSVTGEFRATLTGTLDDAFAATNKALDYDMKYYRMSEVLGDNSRKVRARAIMDKLVIVELKETKRGNKIAVTISFDGGNLAESQKIYKAISSRM